MKRKKDVEKVKEERSVIATSVRFRPDVQRRLKEHLYRRHPSITQQEAVEAAVLHWIDSEESGELAHAATGERDKRAHLMLDYILERSPNFADYLKMMYDGMRRPGGGY